MKKNKEMLQLNGELTNSLQGLVDQVENLSGQINEYNKKIKKEYSKILIEEKYNLLLKISQGENIDINVLKSKYLKPKELENLNDTPDPKPETSKTDDLLDRIEVQGQVYYYENKEKGKVYNGEYKEVGVYKNRTITLN